MSIKESIIDGWADFPEAFEKAQSHFGGRPFFRGHANANWKLVPSVFRDWQEGRESHLFTSFVRQAQAIHQRCPKSDDLPGWLCLARHYSLPTRLLDWTESLLVAAYFAVSAEVTAGDAHIWALAPCHLNEKCTNVFCLFGMNSPESRRLIQELKNFPKPNLIDMALAASPSHVDLRMTLQRAMFSIHGSPKPLEDFAPECLYKFTIPAARRDQLSLHLRMAGLERHSLFPDLSNLAVSLAEVPFFPGMRTNLGSL